MPCSSRIRFNTKHIPVHTVYSVRAVSQHVKLITASRRPNSTHKQTVRYPSFPNGYSVIMEKISWTDRVQNEEVLLTVKKERNILHTVNMRKAN
jgi:hypothetical protein